MTTLSFRLNKNDIVLEQQLDLIAKNLGKSKTEILKDAIREYLSRHDPQKSAYLQSKLIAKHETASALIDSDIDGWE